jgi:Flavoprotein
VTGPVRALTVIACAAGPASRVGVLVALAQERGWTVRVVATPATLDFLDLPAIEEQAGSPVRSQYRHPGDPRSQPADAIIVAPATFNTINKWAQGISDTYALGLLAEDTGLGVPIVALPFVNTALAGRAPFRRSVEVLRLEGVQILLGPGGFEPHPPRAGGEHIDGFPWHTALDCLEQRCAELAAHRRERAPTSAADTGQQPKA